MSRDAILATIRELLRTQLGYTGPVEAESDLASDLGLDSVQLLSLVVELENTFRVVIEPDGEEPLVTVGEVVALIERCQREQAAA
jgi:acyl carrier protein